MHDTTSFIDTMLLISMLTLGAILTQPPVSASSRACADYTAATNARPVVTPASSLLRVVRRVTLPESGPAAVQGIRSLDMRADGTMLLVDSRQPRVSLRTASLGLTSILGREGSGPGEYRIPIQGWFSSSGDIWVLDMNAARLQAYTASGTYRKSVPGMPLDARVAFELTDSSFLIVGPTRTPRGNHVATAFRYNGQQAWNSVLLDPRVLELDLIVDGAWATRLRDGSAVVGMSVVPDVTQIDATTGAIRCRSRIPAAFWRQLTARERPRNATLAVLRQWIEAASVARVAVALPDGGFIVEIEGGAKGAESPRRSWVLFDSRLAPRQVVDDVPGRIVRTKGDTLLVIDDEAAEGVAIHYLVFTAPIGVRR